MMRVTLSGNPPRLYVNAEPITGLPVTQQGAADRWRLAKGTDLVRLLRDETTPDDLRQLAAEQFERQPVLMREQSKLVDGWTRFWGNNLAANPRALVAFLKKNGIPALIQKGTVVVVDPDGQKRPFDPPGFNGVRDTFMDWTTDIVDDVVTGLITEAGVVGGMVVGALASVALGPAGVVASPALVIGGGAVGGATLGGGLEALRQLIGQFVLGVPNVDKTTTALVGAASGIPVLGLGLRNVVRNVASKIAGAKGLRDNVMGFFGRLAFSKPEGAVTRVTALKRLLRSQRPGAAPLETFNQLVPDAVALTRRQFIDTLIPEAGAADAIVRANAGRVRVNMNGVIDSLYESARAGQGLGSPDVGVRPALRDIAKQMMDIVSEAAGVGARGVPGRTLSDGTTKVTRASLGRAFANPERANPEMIALGRTLLNDVDIVVANDIKKSLRNFANFKIASKETQRLPAMSGAARSAHGVANDAMKDAARPGAVTPIGDLVDEQSGLKFSELLDVSHEKLTVREQFLDAIGSADPQATAAGRFKTIIGQEEKQAIRGRVAQFDEIVSQARAGVAGRPGATGLPRADFSERMIEGEVARMAGSQSKARELVMTAVGLPFGAAPGAMIGGAIGTGLGSPGTGALVGGVTGALRFGTRQRTRQTVEGIDSILKSIQGAASRQGRSVDDVMRQALTSESSPRQVASDIIGSQTTPTTTVLDLLGLIGAQGAAKQREGILLPPLPGSDVQINNLTDLLRRQQLQQQQP